MLPAEIHYSSITDEDGRRLGFRDEDLAKFDIMSDLDLVDDALRYIGIEPIRLGYGRELVEVLLYKKPPMLWNLNQGLLGPTREAQVPAVCEMLGIPLVGSGSWTAFMTQDKVLGKNLVRSNIPDVYIADAIIVDSANDLVLLENINREKKYIVKPRREGSSRGVDTDSVLDSHSLIENKVQNLLEEWGPVMVEEYIEGLDISADIASDGSGNLIPMMPIFSGTTCGIQTGYHKTTSEEGPVLNIIPPDSIDTALISEVRSIALRISHIFKAQHYFRIDLRFEESSRKIFFLEANITPAFALDDNYVIAANFSGMSFPKLIENILSAACADAANKVYLEDTPRRVRETLRDP